MLTMVSAKWLMGIISSNPRNSIIGKLPEKGAEGWMKRVKGVKYGVTEGD